ncbi:TRAP transporter large permease subunit [Aliiroseovarius sp. S1339]|uniref:TRAP transporter large permease n=1 Tax=Aliiroseovarius sp. S1339 TaxID=2936990 RepID=UPI0020BE9DA5|nr:TRAP transporter large permease subunit [Aliiroseovarius sp. S1339]MCK8463782.1 TRAP transporter large permease subunit [Aliiroseovarius sp. S1339]
MSESFLPLAMAGLTLTAIFAGYRVGMALAGSAAIFILLSDLPVAFFNLLVSRIYANVLSNWLLVAVPMFILMGLIMEISGAAERSLRASQRALGGSAAGMGFSVLVIGVLLAASSGIVGASVVLLALLALPRLEEAGFDKPTSAGLIAASGTLAILIPPSVMLIVLGDQLQTPVPDMFAGAIGPGLLLVLAYGAFIIWGARGLPALVQHDRISVPQLIFDLGPLLVLVISVLGSIVSGIATPTEASGLGAFGAVLITLLYGKFSFAMLKEAATRTVITTSVVLFVMIGATCFSAVFKGIGGDNLVKAGIMAFGSEPYTVLAVVMAAIFLLGFVLDWLEITLILMPIFAPIVAGLDFGNGLSGDTLLIWFGILVAVNLQTSFLTPPFGFSLFYLRGAAGDALTTPQIYRGVLPFIALQVLVLVLLILFPGLITGLTS